MAQISNDTKKMFFVGNKLKLPLFLVSRNRIKYKNLEPMRTYITRKRLDYTRHCNQENRTEDANTRHMKHIVGLDSYAHAPCAPRRVLKYSRDLISVRPWHLAPNRYDVPPIPFEFRRGRGGAHWPKIGMTRGLQVPRNYKPPFRFYELLSDVERMTKPCHQHKGVFLTNARTRRACARCMVDSTATCYHNPKDPGPTTHAPQNHVMSKFISKVIHEHRPNPHIFLRQSCVPAKPLSVHPRHISFKPGPGRYETRYRMHCGCRPNLRYMPELQLMIDREKRMKFRRLPYTKIKTQLYCAPDWAHVTGHGHRRLFRNAPKRKAKLKQVKDAKKTERQIALFPDARYISMITEPNRLPISTRLEPMIELPPRVFYNCMARRVMRRTLRNNKKIAFNSGQERWPDADRPPILTATQLERLKERLPEERRLRDLPVMQVSMSQIKSRLQETPPHMQAGFELELRKPLFKFLPLPGAKVLVTEADTRASVHADGRTGPVGFFNTVIDPHDFFKKVEAN